MNKAIAICALACCTALAATVLPAQGTRDPISTPASSSAFGVRSALTAVANAGSRLIAVGRRGVILVSDDAGAHWRQVASPVSGDLTAVRFQDAQHGWIVGHDAVVLKSTDGGLSWQRKLDGRSALALLSATYGAQGSAADATIAQDIERAGAQSATPGVLPYPLLDVWFASADEGYVGGAFGLLLHTTDGGASWTPMMERSANARMNHIYAIGGAAGQVYLAGEQGFLRRRDAASGSFVAIDSPYDGSYFGLYADGRQLLVHGLRGNAYVQEDGGAWQKIDTGSAANIVAALPAPDGGMLLVTQGGEVLSGASGGAVSRLKDTRKSARGGEVYGAALSGAALVAAGPAGASLLRTISTQ